MATDLSGLYISQSFQNLVQRSASGAFNVLATATGTEFIPVSASYAISASYALTTEPQVSASYAVSSSQADNSNTSTSASHALNADVAISSSHSVNSDTAISSSHAVNSDFSISSSHALNADVAISSSHAVNSDSAISSSHALNADNAISSSYALTASFAENVSIPTLQQVTDVGATTTNAITASGAFINGNAVISGDLDVNGTITYISSSTLQIGDNVIEINYNKAAGNSGIITYDTTSPFTASLLWDATADRWIAGAYGSEETIILAGDTSSMSVANAVSSSHAITSDTSISASHALNADNAISSSYALTASYVAGGGGGGTQLSGSNYIYVSGSGTEAANATELTAALAVGVAATPNGSSKSATNRFTVVVAPGNYDFTAADLDWNTDYVDFRSLTGEKDVYFSNATYTFQLNTNDAKITGIDTGTKAFKVATNLANVIVNNCKGGNDSFGTNQTISGTYIDCEAGGTSFAGNGGTASGTFINCKSPAQNLCFGALFGASTGVFENCSVDLNFAGYSVAQGSYIRCSGIQEFLRNGIGASGRAYNCIAVGTNNYGQSGPTNILGQVLNCITGTAGTGATADLFPGVGAGGKLVNSIDGLFTVNNIVR